MKKTENVNDILHVAKIIRKELTEHTSWKFKGTFQTVTLPPLLIQGSTMDTYWSKRKY